MVKTVKKSLVLAAILVVGGELVGSIAIAEEIIEVDVKVNITQSFSTAVTELNFGEILAESVKMG